MDVTVFYEAKVGIWRKGCACLSWSTVDRRKRSTVRERKRKREREREVCLWLVTRSREEIPACAHTYTRIHTHRCKNIESRDTSERIKTCFVWATGLVFMCVHLCMAVCVCVLRWRLLRKQGEDAVRERRRESRTGVKGLECSSFTYSSIIIIRANNFSSREETLIFFPWVSSTTNSAGVGEPRTHTDSLWWSRHNTRMQTHTNEHTEREWEI